MPAEPQAQQGRNRDETSEVLAWIWQRPCIFSVLMGIKLEKQSHQHPGPSTKPASESLFFLSSRQALGFLGD